MWAVFVTPFMHGQELIGEELIRPSYSGCNDISSICHPSFYGIQFASPSTKAELEYCYFTKIHFSFEEPYHVDLFLDHLSVSQRGLLRNIICLIRVEQYPPFSCWMDACALLPPTL